MTQPVTLSFSVLVMITIAIIWFAGFTGYLVSRWQGLLFLGYYAVLLTA